MHLYNINYCKVTIVVMNGKTQLDPFAG